jgi:putative restriction endonuclease
MYHALVSERAASTDDEIVRRFLDVKAWQRGDERAPHKPLLLLWLLARVQEGKEARVHFSQIEEPLRDLLIRFGPKRASYHPEYPFYHLKNDGGLWSLEGIERIERTRQGNTDPTLTELRRVDPRGVLDPGLCSALRSRPDLVNRIAHEILDAGWDPSYHEDILDAVGFPWVVETVRPRDSGFRETVLRIYERRCAVCGFDGRLGDVSLAVEAAHVRWHSAGGPDTPDNGIAMCSIHHRAFDFGALGLDEDRKILVSQDAHGGSAVETMLLCHSGKQLRPPMAGEPPPAASHIRWHLSQVFRQPPRSSSGKSPVM